MNRAVTRSDGEVIDLVIARSDGLDEAAFRRLRASLPVSRRERADRYRRKADRDASVVVFSLLQYLWRRRVGGPLPDVVRGERGKPRFRGVDGWHFNLSHDASVCVCALSPVPVGVDVQSRVPFDDRLFETIAAPGERHLRGELLRADDLSPLWTRKEAVVKRSGRGLSTPLGEVDTVAATDVLTAADRSGFLLSISAEGLREDQPASGLRVRYLRPGPEPGGWSEDRDHPPLFGGPSGSDGRQRAGEATPDRRRTGPDAVRRPGTPGRQPSARSRTRQVL
ncbi:4'-phosphopantetheinyl transferase family protein [Myceligenerans xiligouense]|uniref:4'-phosphopantetheinyl transferase n=1 Tax=Myceligenerans xiligouense TaxID=253184 RepID=A0A3N4YMI2_9MICO|nr:4'-phosphopantetheinyl transferase superfamily protein [Myceligenerans xiligouense]RPF22269.1 4'-phosphopantetheinyl transferase [Myceligenerans xiligouense]